MNVMDAVLACYGSHKGHTPSERTGKCGNFVETWGWCFPNPNSFENLPSDFLHAKI